MFTKGTRLILVLTLVALLAVIAACTAAPTPAPTQAPPTAAPQPASPTQAPAPTTAPAATAKPATTATSAPAATAAPTSGGAKVMTSADVRVAMVPGGPHPYFLPWQPGLADAVNDFKLGVSEFNSPPEWTLASQNQLINSLVARGFNAYGIFPGDVNGTNATINELVAKGYPVLAVAGCVSEPTKSTFCLATDVGQSAYLGTKALIKAMGGKGKIIHGTGFLVDPNTQIRIKAVERAVAETNGAVTLVQVLADIDSQEAADKAINSFLAAHGKEIDGIVTSAYIPSTVSATALRNLGDKRIKMVGIDDDPIVLNAIKDGYLSGTMAQNPYGQAYVGAMVLNSLSTGCKRKAAAPYFIDSGTLLISNDNLTTYHDQLKDLTKQMAAEFKNKYLDCP